MPASTPAEALAEQFAAWSLSFHRFYWDCVENITTTRKHDDVPTLFEVFAFFYFVLVVRTLDSRQDVDAREDLCLHCIHLAVDILPPLNGKEYVQDLLDSRGEMYFECVKSGTRKNVASFFETWTSPLKNQLAWAREGRIAGSSEVIPQVISGFLDDFHWAQAWVSLYARFVAPFIMVLHAVLDDNADFRLLPIDEVRRRIDRALAEAAK